MGRAWVELTDEELADYEARCEAMNEQCFSVQQSLRNRAEQAREEGDTEEEVEAWEQRAAGVGFYVRIEGDPRENPLIMMQEGGRYAVLMVLTMRQVQWLVQEFWRDETRERDRRLLEDLLEDAEDDFPLFWLPAGETEKKKRREGPLKPRSGADPYQTLPLFPT